MDKKKKAEKFRMSVSRKSDTDSIIGLVNAESRRTGAVLELSDDKVTEWVENKASIVMKAKGNVVGHLAAHHWPESGWIELRSLVVDPDFRGMRISGMLMNKMISLIDKKYGKRTLVAFENKAGKSKNLLLALGFKEEYYENLPKELFTIGAPYRGKKEYGYSIFIR